MRIHRVTQDQANQRLDRFLRKYFQSAPSSTLQKWLREKRVRVNGVHARFDTRLEAGDELQLYIADRYFEKPDESSAYKLITAPRLSVIYEDENILLLDKPAGMLCHSDANETVNTLLSHMQSYLFQKGELANDDTFAPSLANRIDRNTRGIVLAAKNAEALRVLSDLIRRRCVDKYYLCLVRGLPSPPDGVLRGYLLRDMKRGLVSVYDAPRPGAKYAETHYRTLEQRADTALCECRLVTGRTHQIRAQFAHMGNPLVGDGKYGVLQRGEKAGQVLVSYKVVFSFSEGGGILDYLAGRSFEIEALL